jgi:hypothetical protein
MEPTDQEVIGTGLSIANKLGLVGVLLFGLFAVGFFFFNMHVNATECARQDIKQCQSDLVAITIQTSNSQNEMAKAILELKLTLDRLSRAIETKYPVAIQ